MQDIICGYRVTALLASDALSELLAVTAPALGAHVSMRRLSAEATKYPAVVSCFVGEFAEQTTQLCSYVANGPQAMFLSEILGRGLDANGCPYLLMRHAGGELLDAWLTRRPSRWSESHALRFGLALAQALAKAHENRVVHGGVHPGAIVLPPAAELLAGAPPLLINFGLRNLIQRYEHASGKLLPLPPVQHPYLAPEVHERAPTTGAADVFALGAVLRQLLFGSASPNTRPATGATDTRLERLLESMQDLRPTQRPLMAQVVGQLACLLNTEASFTIEQHLPAPAGETIALARCQQTKRQGVLHRVVGAAQPAAAAGAEALLLGAQRLMGLSCPGLCNLLSYGSWPDRGTYVFVEPPFQETLATYLHTYATPRTEALAVIAQLAQTLAALHEKGGFHLGVRPERVAVLSASPLRVLLLVGDGQPAAAAADPGGAGGRTLTATPAPHDYLAPELANGEPGGAAADVYSLGALLHHLLYRAPAAGPELGASTTAQTRAESASQVAPRVSSPTVSRELQELLRSMVDTLPARRPTMAEVARLLPWLGLVFQILNGPPLAGKYTIVRQLSSGGMGAIFEGINVLSNGRVALKIPYPQFSHDRIRQEVRAAIRANSQHPGIVQIFDCEQFPNGTPYIVMEFLEGELLSDRIARCGPSLAVTEVVRLGRQIASALAAAHSVGVIHRDLKPDNVMIVRDPVIPGGERAKVFDFGIAKLVSDYQYQECQRLTCYGTFMGTLYYSAPEQRSNAAGVSEQADVFSLGAMFYEMLGGPLPLQPPLRPLGPPWLIALITGMTAVQPAARPTMAAVEKALQDRLHERGPHPRVPILAVLMGMFVILLGALSFVLLYRIVTPRRVVLPPALVDGGADKPSDAMGGDGAAPEIADLGVSVDASSPRDAGQYVAPSPPPAHPLHRCYPSQLHLGGVSRFSVVNDRLFEVFKSVDLRLGAGEQLVLQPTPRGMVIRTAPRGMSVKRQHQLEASMRAALGNTPLPPGGIAIDCKRR